MWLKALKFLWPFFKELFLGDLSLKQAVQNHKLRVLGLGMVLMSVSLNMFTIPRLVTITRQHLELIRDYQELAVKSAMPVAEPYDAPAPFQPVPLVPDPVVTEKVEKPVKPAKHPKHPKASAPTSSNIDEEQYYKVRQHFEYLKKEENDE